MEMKRVDEPKIGKNKIILIFFNFNNHVCKNAMFLSGMRGNQIV